MKKWFSQIGPATLIAAAFIGPGTVTLCSIAGVNFGYQLLWAMLLSIAATVILQEMSARLGLISQKGLAEVLREEINQPLIRIAAIILVISAIIIGNAAYEAGNISGGVLGLSAIFPNNKVIVSGMEINILSPIVGVLAFALLYIGSYKVLERSLIALVVLMSISFLVTALMTKPDLETVFKGLFIPSIPENGLLTIVGLIGTTVVPYNLFLHASIVKERWKKPEDLKFVVKDTVIAILVGGMVSLAIIISAAGSNLNEIQNAVDLAEGLVPLYGASAKYFMAIGLFASGITSAITAPLAAAYAAKGIFGWKDSMKSNKIRSVWMFILFLGVLFSSLNIKSIEIIKFAQVTNGILLPVISGFLLWVMNKKNVLGSYVNNHIQNVFGFIILGVTIFLGARSIWKVFYSM